MNAKLPDPPRRPRGDGVRSPRTGPSAPVGGVRGARLPWLPVLEAAATGGTPAGEGCPPASSPAGPNVPEGGAAGEGRSRPLGVQPEALSGKDFRAAYKKALSGNGKAKRNQRARPWIGRDPLRDGWRPRASRSETRRRTGQIVAWRHGAYRVIESEPVPEVDWSDSDRE